jgi:hypothetical protein
MATINQEVMARMMLHGLREGIAAALRERFQQEAQPIIEEAVQSALASFEATLHTYKDQSAMQDIIQVVLVDKRNNERPF